jgi:hypothetical protein
MQLLGFLGVAALALASLAVGARLVVLGLRGGRAPELWIGLSYLFAGFLSCVATLAVGEMRRTGSELADATGLAAAATLHAGVACLAVFVWSVFRRGTRGGTAAVCAAVAYVALTFVGVALEGPSQPGAGAWAALAGRIAVYTWAAAESFAEWAAARRRVRLGLADPLVANRLLLWGVGTGCVLALWIHSGLTMLRGQTDATASYPLIAVLGITCAATSWLAFFPPAFYRRRFAAPEGPAGA